MQFFDEFASGCAQQRGAFNAMQNSISSTALKSKFFFVHCDVCIIGFQLPIGSRSRAKCMVLKWIVHIATVMGTSGISSFS